MTDDPLWRRGVELLARAHNLYAGDYVVSAAVDPAVASRRLGEDADRLAGVSQTAGPAPAAATAQCLSAGLWRTAAADTELAALLAAARDDRALRRRATRALLDDALAETTSGADTALGRREGMRRMLSRLQTQQRHIRGSRRRSRLLARRMRRLRYRQLRLRYDRPVTRGGGVDEVVARALDHLGVADPSARGNWARGYATLIARESGGRASAVAAEPATAAGPAQPDGIGLGYARGLTQTIPATFARYHQPGTATNIYDPVANVCASMNYVMHRYGVDADGANLAALVQQADEDRPPKGY